MHRALNLILESLRNDDLAQLCEGGVVGPGELAALRDAFISAGCAGVRNILEPDSWFQINVQFDPLGLQWYSFAAGEFQDRVRRWISLGVLQQFCYVHKPPGLRLRFQGERAALVSELTSAFTQLTASGNLSGWSCGLYDAEPYQFGGVAGIALAHRYFTAESLAVLAFHRLRLRREASLDPTMFSLLLVDLLLREATGDIWERWDVWRRMEATGRTLALEGDELAAAMEKSMPARQALSGMLGDPERTIGELSAGERQIVEEYRAALPAIARDLRHAHDHGELLWGMREILPFWIVFHWNRMTFGLEEQRGMTFLMATLHSPHAR